MLFDGRKTFATCCGLSSKEQLGAVVVYLRTNQGNWGALIFTTSNNAELSAWEGIPDSKGIVRKPVTVQRRTWEHLDTLVNQGLLKCDKGQYMMSLIEGSTLAHAISNKVLMLAKRDNS